MYKLSKRLREGVEAAPWVIEEIKKLEQELNDVYLELHKIRSRVVFDRKIHIEAKRRYEEWCKQ
jgi:hypothetical protein